MDEDDFFDRINRILRPEGAAEMGAFLGASMLPGIGEGIDVADILMGLRERDAQRIGFGALGLALPFVAGGTLRRIAGGSGMDTPPSTVPKTPPKDDLPDGFGVHVDPLPDIDPQFKEEDVFAAIGDSSRPPDPLWDLIEESDEARMQAAKLVDEEYIPFDYELEDQASRLLNQPSLSLSQERGLAQYLAGGPLSTDEMSAMIAGRELENMPQVFSALQKRLDKEFDAGLEREDLIDLIAGAYPKEFDDIVKTLTQGRNLDLDLEEFGPKELAETRQFLRFVNERARETLPKRQALEQASKLITEGEASAAVDKMRAVERMAKRGTLPRTIRVYRSDTLLGEPLIGTTTSKDTAQSFAPRLRREIGQFVPRQPSIRTFDIQPEDVSLDVVGVGDELGIPVRFEGERELVVPRDVLAKGQVINPDDYERMEDYLLAVARMGMDPPRLEEYARSLQRQRKNMPSDPIVPLSRPAKEHELQKMVETRQLLDPPPQGFKASGLPSPQAVKVFTNPGSVDAPLLDPTRPQFELYSRADVRKDLKTSMQEAMKEGITDAGEIIPPDPDLLAKLVKEAELIAGPGPKQTNVPPLRNPSYFANDPWAAAQDLRSALRGTPLNTLAINAATLGSKMTRGLDPSKPNFIGKKKGTNIDMARLRHSLQDDVNKMLEVLETYKEKGFGSSKSRSDLQISLLPSIEKWTKAQKGEFIVPTVLASHEAFFDKMRLNLRRMSDAQRKVPIYNEMQKFGRDIAVAVGEGEFEEADRLLQSLKLIVDDRELFVRKMLEYGIPDPSIPEVIRRRVGYHVDDRPL